MEGIIFFFKITEEKSASYVCHRPSSSIGLAQSHSSECDQRQTMNHVVNTCSLTKFEGGLNLLHKADNDAGMWLESTVTAALVK